MKKIKLSIVVLILNSTFLILNCSAQTAKPKTKQPTKTAVKPKVESNKPTQVSKPTHEPVALGDDSLSKLKAVLVVGPSEDVTQSYIDEIKGVSDYLQSLGVQVKEFFHPNAEWKDIVSASKGVHIFVYSGHGTTMGEKGCSGGFYLSGETFVSSDSIFTELKLHKNALILFHSVCMSAGSSASDNRDIGVQKAITRVSDYAHPFIKLGAAGYYANNYDGSLKRFLSKFFNKNSIKQIYTEAATSWSHIEMNQTYKFNSKFELSVASNKSTGFSIRTTYINGKKKEEKIPCFKSYDIAYVGIPTFTVIDFFK